MHQILIKIHVWSSILFLIVAIILCVISIIGFIKKSEFTKKHIFIENIFIALLYLGLILGIILYFFISPNKNLDGITYEIAQKDFNSRFWAIEHFSVMLFALLLSQIGKIFTKKSIKNQDKFKYAIFYYGAATLITIFSTGIFLYYKFI
ncbi:MAG: hypothetical protein JXR51_03550 [Bacteroidales bacterium]|nr:hypothetical protein [Bacteroidales bacterium]MBN2756228.1 hypothetical protein [Bacteroidales bacterium]